MVNFISAFTKLTSYLIAVETPATLIWSVYTFLHLFDVVPRSYVLSTYGTTWPPEVTVNLTAEAVPTFNSLFA